ncbi:DUF3613 domain-containing protein [Pigmentiphaga aceris]|uniref:DUF3613 domain-containing protein n=1 Tax=Pigmentiphaga aceris TaxID=1940612 RepID=A0A5C0ATF9_9BURK|nr:DUF3613 domain-containing protein [Pigmentiphaga aceris]QEI05649.1 DUF3613 domain-containing protein [Pigmentiphaga aceris]
MHLIPKLARSQVPDAQVRCRQLLLGLVLSGTAWLAHAQPAPQPSTAMTAAPNVGAVPSAPGRAPVVGATARHLLEAQSSGRIAAPGKPMSGATASASWKRYVDTFSHPVPEFFESRVGKKTSE